MFFYDVTQCARIHGLFVYSDTSRNHKLGELSEQIEAAAADDDDKDTSETLGATSRINLLGTAPLPYSPILVACRSEFVTTRQFSPLTGP
jgi:hypothetical protein